MDSSLYKEAALAIESLRTELEQTKEAIKLAFCMLQSGVVSVDKLESTIEMLSSKSTDEQSVMRKGLEFSKTSEYSTSFRVDYDTPEEEPLPAEEAFFFGLMN